MTEQPVNPDPVTQSWAATEPGSPAGEPPSPAPHAAASAVPAAPGDRPEMALGAAFAGGLVFALILKRLAR